MSKYLNSKAVYRFFKVPAAITEDERYSHLSYGAMLLYAKLISRMELSERNGWQDKIGVYIHYTVAEICSVMHCSKGTAVKMLQELEKAMLIEKHKSFNSPAKIYILAFSGATEPTEDRQEAVETECVYDETDVVSSELIEQAREFVDSLFYDANADGSFYAVEMVPIKQLMADTLATGKAYVRIGNRQLPTETVRERFAKLDNDTVIRLSTP